MKQYKYGDMVVYRCGHTGSWHVDMVDEGYNGQLVWWSMGVFGSRKEATAYKRAQS